MYGGVKITEFQRDSLFSTSIIFTYPSLYFMIITKCYIARPFPRLLLSIIVTYHQHFVSPRYCRKFFAIVFFYKTSSGENLFCENTVASYQVDPIQLIWFSLCYSVNHFAVVPAVQFHSSHLSSASSCGILPFRFIHHIYLLHLVLAY